LYVHSHRHRKIDNTDGKLEGELTGQLDRVVAVHRKWPIRQQAYCVAAIGAIPMQCRIKVGAIDAAALGPFSK